MGYHTFTIPKKSGGGRVITAPDETLKQKQRKLLKELQNRFWISKRAHGFTRKRNILTNAKCHLGKKWIMNLDIRDFFPSITGIMIRRIKQTDGEEGGINLDTTTVLHEGALPQGAPTSPFLSNYCMREFDTQIVNLLRKLISDDIEYTRYADDMTFSSNSHAVENVEPIIEKKLASLGLELNPDKTRLAGRGQRQEVTGLNVNSGCPTIPKKYRRRVRALIHRASNGWLITDKQKASLLGKISHIALCHQEEAKRYRDAILPVKTTPGVGRKLSGVRRIALKVKNKAKNKSRMSPAETNGQKQVRKLTKIE